MIEAEPELPLIFAAIVSVLINIPQLYKTWRTHNVEGFSVYTLLLRILSNVLWISYALLIQEWLIFSISVLNGLSELGLLLMKYNYIIGGNCCWDNLPNDSMDSGLPSSRGEN